jgi:hypothetical protein
MYRKARSKWVEAVAISKSIYMADITVGEEPQQRGSWSDRLPAIDKDIALLSQRLEAAPTGSSQTRVSAAIQEVSGRPHRWVPDVRHEPLKKFRPGEPLDVVLSMTQTNVSIRLYYRHVDQAERYTAILMEPEGEHHRATIPAGYTNTEYPLEYYFEIREGKERAGLFPGFSTTLVNQPYFVVRRA